MVRIYRTDNDSGDLDFYESDESLRISTWCSVTGGLGGGITLSRNDAIAAARAILKHYGETAE